MKLQSMPRHLPVRFAGSSFVITGSPFYILFALLFAPLFVLLLVLLLQFAPLLPVGYTRCEMSSV